MTENESASIAVGDRLNYDDGSGPRRCVEVAEVKHERARGSWYANGRTFQVWTQARVKNVETGKVTILSGTTLLDRRWSLEPR